MNPLRKLINNFTGKGAKMDVNLIGAPSFSQVNPYGLYGHFTSDAYSSAYPSIRAIANEYMGIRPYAIDQNGKTVQNNSIINALYHPNKLDSSVSFFEKIAVSTLVLPKTYILVWRNEGGVAQPGGDFGRQGKNIAGFTFLERPAITVRDRVTYYNVGSQEFTENEVIVLTGGVDPHDLYGGYSPSIAAKRWATLDDYIVDFQKGYFENGAVPAGQFIITSASSQDFEDTKKTLQEKHRGAGNNNNIAYVPRPLGENGKPADAKIEWIPFAQSNREIDLKNLFEQTNKRLDLAFGVPQIVKGVDDAATYANAQVADAGFSKRAVYPLALRNYTQITHELNRITGGIGVAITFQYDIPVIADAEKVKAETVQIEFDTLKSAIEAGFTLESAVEALKLPNNFKLFKLGEEKSAVIENDKPDVDEGDEVDNAPDPKKIDGVTPLNKGEVKTKNPKAELSDLQRLESAARKYMQSQVDRAVSEYRDEPVDEVNGEPTEDERTAFVEAMLVVITGILVAKGEEGYATGTSILEAAGSDTANLTSFNLKEATQDSYRAYLRRVGETYGQDTAEAIREVLAESKEIGLSRAETEKALKNIMNTEEYRIKRVGVTELNRSQGIGSVEGIKQIQNETGVILEKSLSHPQGAECQFCKAMEGVWASVDQPLIGLGDSVIGVDGGILVNDFVENEGYDPHPNGKGVTIYRVAA